MEVTSVVAFFVMIIITWYHVCTFPLLVNLLWSCTVFCAVGCYFIIKNISFDYFSVLKENLSPLELKNASEYEDSVSPLSDNSFDDEISLEFRKIIGHIVRDFILDWYNNVTNDVEFVQEAFELFDHLFSEIRKRVSIINKHEFTTMIIDVLTTHYVCYKTALSNCIQTNDSERKEELTIIEYEKLNGHRSLSGVPNSEVEHQRAVVLIALKCLLPANYKLTGPSLLLVRELIACNVLTPFLQLMASPVQVYSIVHSIFGDEEVSEELTQTNCETKQNIQVTVSVEGNSVPTAKKLPEVEGSESASTAELSQDNRFTLASECNNSNNNGAASPQLDVDEKSLLIDPPLDSEMTSNKDSSDFDLMPIFPTHFAETLDGGASNSDYFTEQLYRSMPLWSSDTSSASDKDCLFQNLCISETSTMCEPYQASLKYTLYKISYFASKKTTDEDDSPKYFEVQRRFREFKNLQERLGRNNRIRKAVNKIRGPSSFIYPLPVATIDTKGIEKRRQMLEEYLRELCSLPIIASSDEMKEFLAFDSDPRIAFVGLKDKIPRFDKILMNAFDSATTTLSDMIFSADNEPKLTADATITRESSSNNDSNLYNDASSLLSSRLHGSIDKLKTILTKSNSFNNIEVDYEACSRLYQPVTDAHNIQGYFATWNSSHSLLLNKTITKTTTVGKRRTQGDGCEILVACPLLQRRTYASRVLMAAKILWKFPLNVCVFCYVYCGFYVNSFIESLIEEIFNKEKWVHYLKVLKTTLWPNGKWASDSENNSRDVKKVRKDAQNALEKLFPDFIPLIIGTSRYSGGVNDFLESFSCQNINQHVVMHLIDNIISLTFPDIQHIAAHRPNIDFD